MSDETQLQGGQAQAIVTEEGASSFNLESIIEETGLVRKPEDRARAKDLMNALAEEVLKGEIQVQGDLINNIQACIADIDELISAQLNEVMHTSEFQKLEATWRGVHALVHQSETGERLKIRVLNSSKKELLSDLERAPEFDQSTLFKKVYEAEYGMSGGEPYGLLIGDYEFSHGAQDVALLERISNVAAAAHAPFVAAASPELFGMDSFEQLEAPRDLAKIFTQPEYVTWRSFRDKEDSRYSALVLPHYLARLPYGRDTVPVEAFDFEEDVDGQDHSKYLWANAAYQYGIRITDAFSRYGWCTAIRGLEGGGKVEDLPAHTFKTDSGEVALKCPTEVSITDRREKELSDLGFISLVHYKNTNYAAFVGGQTLNKPAKYMDDDANANAQLSARLPYMMATNRIAHYLKAIVRDKIGGFTTKDSIQKYLEKWISNYVLLDDNATDAAKARRPLREAKVLVEEVPGQPGVYQARAWLRPHFQLEAMSVSLRLVAKLPTAK